MAIKNYRFQRILVTNSETRYKAQYRKDDIDYIGTGTKGVLIQSMDKKLPDGTTAYTIKFEPKQAEVIIPINVDEPRQVDFINLIKGDPEVKTKQKIDGAFRFELIDDEEEVGLTVIDIKARTEVSNILLARPLDALKELCYFFNFNIVGMTKSGIIAHLLNPATGVMWQPVLMGGVYVDPKEVVLKQGYDEDYQVKSAVNKAILLGIIKLNSNNTYVFGDNGVILGVSVDNIYAYFKSNRAIFESSLLVAVRAGDSFNEDIDFSKDIEDVKGEIEDLTKNQSNSDILLKCPNWSSPERIAMEEWLKALLKSKGRSFTGNIEGFKNDTLKAKIESALQS